LFVIETKSLNLASYDTSSTFNQQLSYGFIPLWGLQSQIGFQIKNTIKSEQRNNNKPKT